MLQGIFCYSDASYALSSSIENHVMSSCICSYYIRNVPLQQCCRALGREDAMLLNVSGSTHGCPTLIHCVETETPSMPLNSFLSCPAMLENRVVKSISKCRDKKNWMIVSVTHGMTWRRIVAYYRQYAQFILRAP